MLAAALVSLLLWIGLLAGRGGFWRAAERLADAPEPPDWPPVAILIPARNEARTIAEVIRAHARCRYPGARCLVVADDSSTDGTGARAREAIARFPGGAAVIDVPPLAPGWSGKLWALEAGLAEVGHRLPGARYILLTDADILVGPGLLSRLVARAEAKGLQLVSVMAWLDAQGVWGGLLIPAFVFFFQKLYPFPLVNDPRSGVAAAAGGVVLVRAEALSAIGGFAALRGALIDDCTLAARIKAGPPRRPIELVLADEGTGARSLRDNRALGGIAEMVARTAYTQLRHSPLLLLGTLAGLLLLYLVPPVAALCGAVSGNAPLALAGVAAWLLMALAYRPTLVLYGKPAAAALLLPLAALFYCGFTLLSAVRHHFGGGARWKGRRYSSA
ncbi:glycosyltransferase [Thermaurantiacus sp.]